MKRLHDHLRTHLDYDSRHRARGEYRGNLSDETHDPGLSTAKRSRRVHIAPQCLERRPLFTHRPTQPVTAAMKRLHVHFEKDVDCGCVDQDPDDLLEELPDEYYDPVQRAAKRRRIEKVTRQYLRGRPPFIASAILKGPFNKGWKNPWAIVRREKTVRHNEGEIHTRDRAGVSAQPSALSQVPSVEASRGLDYTPMSSGTLDVPVTQAEAPLSILKAPQEQSGATEFFSLDADPPVTFDLSEHNPFWLRRPRRPPSKGLDFAQSRAGNAAPSPTRSQDRHQPVDRNGGLQLAPPKFPLGPIHSSPELCAPNDAWQSSASASMAITSPVKATLREIEANAPPKSGRLAIFSLSNLTPRLEAGAGRIPTTSHSATEFKPAQNDYSPTILVPATEPRRQMSPPPTFTPINTMARSSRMATITSSIVRVRKSGPSMMEGHRAATELALQGIEKARNFKRARRPSREEIQQSAETCGQSASNFRTRSKSVTMKRTPKAARPEHVASPALNASTGFTYRKVGELKQQKKGAQRPDPRVMTFDSPAAIENEPRTANDVPDVQQMSTPPEEGTSARVDVYEMPGESPDGVEPRRSVKSRESDFSTQAAMMRAHHEFQEGTMTSHVFEQTPRGSLPSPEDTPHSFPHEPSVAFTPFSAFNAELDKQHPPESGLQESPVNTQDLFAAASPFAFSTIKKTATFARSLGSSLRFAVFPCSEPSGYSEAEGTRMRSPTPSVRVPPKDRSTKVAESTMSGEGSQETRESLSVQSKPNRQELELPLLDFGNLLGEFQPTAGLDFADSFLRNLDELT